MKTRVVVVTVMAIMWLAVGNTDAPAQFGICGTELIGPAGPRCVLACPAGDGETLAEKDAVITVIVKNDVGVPIVGIPAADFWLLGCDLASDLCGARGVVQRGSFVRCKRDDHDERCDRGRRP